MIQHKITLVKRREAVGMNHTSMLFLAVKVFGVPLMSEYTYVVQIMSHRHHQKVVRISRRAPDVVRGIYTLCSSYLTLRSLHP